MGLRNLGTIKRISIPASILIVGFFTVCSTTGWLPSSAHAAEEQPEPAVLAWVNEEPIMETEFVEMLKARHKRRIRKTEKTKDFRGLLDDIINDRLIVQEGYRMGLDQEPELLSQLELIEKSAAAEVLIEQEVDEKVSVSEQEAKDYFGNFYKQVHLRQIVTKNREEAETILKKLKEGADFAQMAKESSVGYRVEKGGDIGTFPLHTIYAPLEKSVSNLEVGKLSQPIEAPDGFHIVKLEEVVPADPEQWPKVKDEVEAKLRKVKKAERYEDFVDSLRKKSEVKINREVIDKIDRSSVLKGKLENPEDWVAEVDGTSIKVGHIWKNMSRRMRLKIVPEDKFSKFKEQSLNALIDRVLLRKEAERRKLTDHPKVLDQVERRLRRFVKESFIRLVILPKIDRSDEALRAYYEKHKERYRQPGKIRLARLAVSSQDKALELRKRAVAGTDFNWIVKHESIDDEDLVKKGGDLGWLGEHMLNKAMIEAVDDLSIGDLSEPVHLDSNYYIYLVKDRQQGAIPPFEAVKRQVSSNYMRERVESALSEWAEKLRAVSEVKVNDEQLAKYEKRFKREE